MDLDLKGRVALVTGSSQGIGRAAAVLLGNEGARVGVTYHQHRDKAAAVVEAIERAGSEALAVPLDLAEIDSVTAAARSVLDRWGRIDILVNNAVQWPSRPPWQMPPFEDLPAAEWRPFLRAHTEGPYAAIQAVLPSMRALGWGRRRCSRLPSSSRSFSSRSSLRPEPTVGPVSPHAEVCDVDDRMTPISSGGSKPGCGPTLVDPSVREIDLDLIAVQARRRRSPWRSRSRRC